MPITINEIIFQVKGLIEAGGVVMLPLFFCALLLWYGLGYRFWIMKKSNKMGVRSLLAYYTTDYEKPAATIVERAVKQAIALKKKGVKNLRRHLDEVFYDYQREVQKFSVLTKTIVVISPLLGLLGTVIGMIETFDSLADMVLFTQSGGIAGGISQALMSTQMGLAVAIPGLLIYSMQHKKQQQIERDLNQVKELLCR